MLKTSLKTCRRAADNIKAKRCAAFAFFLAVSITPAKAQTNWVSGIAYGTNDSSTATSIASVKDGAGSLVIGYAGTTNLALDHEIQGFIVISNQAADFVLSATTNAVVEGTGEAVLTVYNATNLLVSGGRFVGTDASTGGPAGPGTTGTTVGGLFRNSSLTIDGSTFEGASGKAGLIVQASDVVISNGVFLGGAGSSGGAGLVAVSNSMVTIHAGSFTGAVGSTAFYLQDSDAAVYDGSFAGNLNGTGEVAGEGLFSLQTGDTTNSIALHGGTFRSLAFYGTDGSVVDFLAGTNLVVENGIIQNNGTVIVDNQGNSALQNITIYGGTMEIQNDFTLSSNGVFALRTDDSMARFLAGFVLGTGAILSNGTGRTEITGNFTQSSGSHVYLVIGATTNGLISANSATFGTGSTLHIDASQAGFSAGNTSVVVIATAAGVTGTNNISVDALALGRISFDGLSLVGGSDLAADFTTLALKDYWNASGQLALLADELESSGNQTMLNAIDMYNDPDASSKAVEQVYFGTFNNFQTALQGMRAAVGQSISRGSELREQLKMTPPGARGPERNNDLRGWFKYYGSYFTHDREQLNPEYYTVLHGGVVGIDRSLGNLVVGISGGSSEYKISHDVHAESTTTAYHGGVYGTYGLERGYIDAGASYGWNQVDTHTSEPFRLDGKFDADIAGAYLGGGYDLVDVGGATVFTPEASIQYATYSQEAYAETGSAAVPRTISAYEADSFLGSIGMNISMLNDRKQNTFGYKADLRMHWMHEFNPDPSDMTFVLQGGGNTFPITYPSLDQDIFRIGIGGAFFNTLWHQPKNVMLRIDFDELFGDGFNSHNLSAKVIYAF